VLSLRVVSGRERNQLSSYCSTLLRFAMHQMKTLPNFRKVLTIFLLIVYFLHTVTNVLRLVSVHFLEKWRHFVSLTTLLWWDLLHLIENTFDRKRIYVNLTSYPNPNSNPSLTLTLTLSLKRNFVFGLTKWRHFSIKCTDNIIVL